MKTRIQAIDPFSIALHAAPSSTLPRRAFNVSYNSLNSPWHEEENKFVLYLAVPGLTRNDLHLNIEGRVLSVSEKTRPAWFRQTSGFSTGRFQYRCLLPEGADPERVEAKCREGLLTITVEKIRNGKKHSIKVLGGDTDKNTGGVNGWWKNLKERMNSIILASF
ncbi:Hsp20/alpha crystallin family protein [Pseudochryseolinea flava]|uniref:SHSP domain-containing protein n=1 Tax=Pseudochryseolinea flava TaxID=2059302 RepID=A0A364Y6N6_9BACT|nr:Hsp20/alpha crystallin family protein [Pseudochryseolinea flava]RAW02600.1 hypothetical protein DQQ10_00340 [Pseudochryseolinea flava]